MTQKKPLWRIPVMWLVIGLPLASIVAGVGLVVIAVRSGGADTVSDDVQRVAQIQTSDLGADRQAELLKLSAVVRIDAGTVEVIPVTGEFDRTQTMQLTVAHPSRAQEDQILELRPSARGWQWQGELGDDHDWRLQLAPADAHWRLTGRLPKQQYAARLAPSITTD